MSFIDDEEIIIDAKDIVKNRIDNEEDEYETIKIKDRGFKTSEGGGPQPKRFVYKGSSKPRKKYLGLIIFLIIIFIIILLYILPSWLADVILKNQLYKNKAGDLSYWQFFYLNGWSTSFIFNYVGLMGGIIGSTIMSIHPLNKLFNKIGERGNIEFLRNISKKKAIKFWWILGFIIFYFIAFGVNTDSMFSFTMYQIQNGTLKFELIDIFLPFIYLSDLAGITAEKYMARIFVYQNLILPIINFILGVIVFKLLLLIYESTLIRSKNMSFKIATYVTFFIGSIFAFNFVSIPTGAYNKLELIQIWSIPIGMFVFYSLSIVLGLASKNFSNRSTLIKKSKAVVSITSILIVIIIFPLLISIPTAIKINNNYDVWESQNWSLKINKQIEWTSNAADLSIFNDKRDINNLTESATSNLVKYIRQFDKEAAIYQMNTIVQSPFETLADSDIVYIDEKEYWVAPKTLKIQHFQGDPTKSNTNMFDHVEGFIALNTFNGTIILNDTEFYSIFGVHIDHPIFFGEYASETVGSYNTDWYYIENLYDETYGAFDDDILLNTGWKDNETNYKHEYTGTPDGSLDGLCAFWKTVNLGLFSYAIDSNFKKEFIINRNIIKRIGDILLPGLWIDSDPYLVFDKNNHKMYYALAICTNLPLSSYSNSPILRFLGVAIIDTELGLINWVKNPMLDNLNLESDPTYPIWKIYLNKYPWHSIDEPEFQWLKSQLRYPETLFESQLQYHYIYHVKDPKAWSGGAQYYDRPQEGDLFYINFDIGEGPEFVGIDLVIRKGYDSNILAGMYVIRHGNNFGNVIFYEAPTVGENKMIGPVTARASFQSAATEELTLIQNKDFGNTLLYPLAGSLYYVVPVYSISGNYENLRKVGLINAFNVQKVVWGSDAEEAYKLLNYSQSQTYTKGNVTLAYEIRDTPSLEGKIIDLNLLYDDDNLSAPQKNIIVNISLRTDIANITKFGQALPSCNFTWGSGKIGMNFTALNISLYPREGYSVGLYLTAEIGNVYSVTIELKVILIVDSEIYEFPPDTWSKVTILG